MTDSDLVRLLQQQCRHPERVGRVGFETGHAGEEAVRESFEALAGAGRRIAVVDALSNDHLMTLGRACAGLRLVTGGSGIAMGLPENHRRAGRIPVRPAAATLPDLPGPAALLCGSCSAASRRQVKAWAASEPALALDPRALSKERIEEGLRWASGQLGAGRSILIYSTAEPDQVAAAQRELGREAAGERVERALGEIAAGLVSQGVRRLVVAGGETSGAVVRALGVSMIRIGPEIDPGVPWATSVGDPQLLLAFKSGNFGSDRFFQKALEVLS